MARQTPTPSNPGVGLGGLLLVLFIALKLTRVISWSWWWVLAPAWVPLVILLIVGIIMVFAYASDKRG